MTDDKTTALTPAMKRVLIAVAAVVVVGIVVVVWLLSATAGGTGPGAAPQGSSNASISPAPTAPRTSPADPGATSGPVPGATPTTGSEARQPSATPGYRLPSITPSKPLVAAPLPPSGSATGSLVSGFPKSIIGPGPKSKVESSSISTQAPAMQVTLVARSTATRASITSHYKKLWDSLGLRPTSTDGSSLTYVGKYESVNLSFSSSGTGNRYTIYGVFRTK
jgi:hypothetical protein